MPVCIAGMHRSGTSMITKVLRSGGLYLGDEADLMPALPDNADGFWENVRFVDLDDQILESQGGWWDCPPTLFEGWSDRALRDHGDAIDALVKPFDGHEPWGWKDPRSSLTIDLWQRRLPGLKVVICLRNPLEVALSLKKRNTFSYALSLQLWYAYNRALMSAVPVERRIVTHYATYFEEASGEVARVLSFAGLPTTEATVREAMTATTQSLRHSHLTLQHLLDARVPDYVIELYLQMCQEAGWLGDGRPPAVPAASKPTRSEPAPVHPSAPHLGAARLDRLAILQRDVQLLQQELESRPTAAALEAASRARETEVASLRDEAAAQRAELASLRETAASLRETAASLDVQHAELRDRVAGLEAQNKGLIEQLETAEAQLALSVAREQPLRQMLLEAQKQVIELEAKPAPATAPPAPPAPPPADPSAAKLGYYKLTHRILGILSVVIPPQARMLVVSKGDDALLQVDGRTGEHFPQDDTGRYAGYTPADSAEAIRRLESIRARGECYFVLPSSGFWWLEFYADFARHLDVTGRRVWADEHCMIYELPEAVADQPAAEQCETVG